MYAIRSYYDFSEKVETFEMLPPSGSYREYCRIGNANRTVIGALNNDIKENTAFLSFSNHLFYKGIKVPKVYSVSSDLKKYLIEDLGNITLFDYLTKTREEEGFRITSYNVCYTKLLRYLV